MGMTYKIVALKPTTTIEQYFGGDESHDPDNGANTIIDDMVFDREVEFRAWCGCPPWIKGEQGYAFRIEKRHLQNALATLRGLRNRVAAMPYTNDAEINPPYHEKVFNKETKSYEDVYHGSAENVAILKEVEKVLSRDYHFLFPWEKPWKYEPFKLMISSLEYAIAFMGANPGRIVIGLYY